MASLLTFLTFVALASCVVNLPPQRSGALKSVKLAVEGPVSGLFDQYIDHANHSVGTFPQRYWVNTEFWNGSGSPVILFNPGEVPALGPNGDFTFYLKNQALTGQYAEAVGGAVIVIEHRYWGESSPYTILSAENLKYLTISQSVQDMINFAQNVVLPFDPSGNSNADKAPWVFVGGSYSGSLAAWIETTAPGTFWAYHASSAPMQAIQNFWQYFWPIQQGMPQVCRVILETLVDYVDNVLTTGTSADKSSLKNMFGMGIVGHDTDFASAIALPLELWQTGEPNLQPFCDAIEDSGTGDTVNLGPLPGYSRYVNIHYACSSLHCYDTYNPRNEIYTDITLDKSEFGGRPWYWMLCNEGLGWWQTGAPTGQKSIVSRLVTADYFQRQCGLLFPGVNFSSTAEQHNAKYGGWNIGNTTRLMFSNGEFDPWRSAGVSSEFRPSGPLPSTLDMPVYLAKDGIHCQDLYMNDPTPEILALRVQEIKQMKSWLDNYYHPGLPSSTSQTLSPSTTLGSDTTTLSSLSAPQTLSTSTTLVSDNTTLSTFSSTSTESLPLETSRDTTTQAASTRTSAPSVETSYFFSIPSITYIQPTRSVIVT
ncbi:serine carboxypeptidase S28-domain-containing protein [Bisporella sp. PMI_857]|nr:serine carboxypeptidase S28-domain-containing protein [Bisporella sp. PMI_857]